MESLFLELEGLLRQMQNDQNLKTERPASESLEEYHHKWMVALEATSEKYLIYMSNPDNKLDYPIYVKFQIYHLVRLLCKIKEKMATKNPFKLKQKKKPKSNKDLLINLFFQTHKGLEFIEQNLIRFVKEQFTAEHKFVLLSKCWIESRLPEFKSKLNDFMGDEELKAAILKVYSKFMEKEQNKLTLNQIIYLKQFIIDTLDQNDDSETESILLNWCIIKNFNAMELFEYYKETYIEDLKNKATHVEKLLLATNHLKYIKQLPVEQCLVFSPNLQSLYDYVIKLIKEECTDLERKIALKSKPDPHKLNYRIKSMITASQMATFIHLIEESEIIEIENKQAFYEFIAPIIDTKMHDGISPLTLRSKSKNLSTKDRDLLIEKFEFAVSYLKNL